MAMGANSVMADCEPLAGIAGEDVSVKMEHDGEVRSYLLHLPTAYDCESKIPLLIGMHGYTGTGQSFEHKWTKLHDHIDQYNYIGVFPDGMSANANALWATGFNDIGSRNDSGPDGLTCKPPPYAYPFFNNCPESDHDRLCYWGNSCADDLAFVRQLIEHMIEQYAVDPKRIYMTGFSQGGSTVNGFAAELADVLAAVAPFHGFQSNGYARGAESKLPFLQVWGTNDDTVRSDGLPGGDNLIYETPEETAKEWARAQSCDENGTTAWPSASDGINNWSCTQHANCSDDSEVVSCSWDGAHTWPINGEDQFGWDVIWAFFMKH
jgi:polyhydroxybutyrate depolymerase